MSHPNVLMVVIDSLRADVTYNDAVPTPNFDALAQRGARFTQCVSTATTTTPSFSSLLTGCYPPKHGVRGLQGYRLSPDVTTLAESFGSAGYRTFAEATGPLLPETGVLRGFQEANHRPGYKTKVYGWVDDVLGRIRAYPEPWFLLLHIWEVHRPFRPPPDFKKGFDRTAYEAVVAHCDEALLPFFEAAGENAVVVLTGDHGEQYPDSGFERLIFRAASKSRRKLQPRKWWPWLDRKLSGQAVGHGFALYEHLIRVPLIVSGPGISTVTAGEQVRHIDLFPTLADLCGVPIPADVDGRSLRPLMEGASLAEEPAYMEAVGIKLEGDRISGARVPDWKLVVAGSGRPALYKLNGGGAPNERRNLYRRHPEVAKSLEDFMARVAASGTGRSSSGMTSDEEAIVEQHLQDLGYL